MEQSTSGKNKKNTVLLVIIIALAAVVAVMAFMLLTKDEPATTSGGMRNTGALMGQVEGKSQEEIQEELNRIVEEGMFNISINSVITLDKGDGEADVRIENVPGNQYLMGVEIALEDSGEIIYNSGLIEPNYHIQTAKFDKVLKAGTYAATATFTAYDLETEEKAGTAGAKVTIEVQR